jgi:uracil-DNA glycosylase family 4
LAIQIKLIGGIKDVKLEDLWQFISPDRINKKDRLINFESNIIKNEDSAHWILDEYEPIDNGMKLMNFLKKKVDKDIPIWPFLTLPRSHEENIEKVKALWDPYYNQYINFEYVNMPSGDLNPDIVFIGEAPGWKGVGEFNVPVYSYGKTSLLFRFLISIIFGPKYWITNISKQALEKNKKMSKDVLEENLKLLKKEIEILQPQVIICLGNYVYDELKEYYNVSKIYHPAYIYRQGNDAQMYARQMYEVKNEISTLLRIC